MKSLISSLQNNSANKVNYRWEWADFILGSIRKSFWREAIEGFFFFYIIKQKRMFDKPKQTLSLLIQEAAAFKRGKIDFGSTDASCDCEHCSQLFIPELPKELQLCPLCMQLKSNLLFLFYLPIFFVFFSAGYENSGSLRLSEQIPEGS